MSMIPGAEFAPTLNQTLRADGLTVTVQRLLDVTDPDDQRVIYRMAAAKLGVVTDNRLSARFAWRWTTGVGHRWCLLVGDFDASIIWEGANGVDDRATATAALCRYLWGPAPCRHPNILVGPHGCTACGDRTVKS